MFEGVGNTAVECNDKMKQREGEEKCWKGEWITSDSETVGRVRKYNYSSVL